MNRILVVGTTLHFWSQEKQITDKLKSEFPDEVVYRPHPRRGGSWQWSAVLELKRQLQDAEMVVAAFSTVVIEAGLMGVRTILVGFGNGEQGRALDHWRYEHMASVARWPTTHIARSESELLQLVAYALANPLICDARRALRAHALAIANCAPGIQERIAQAVEAAW